MRHAAGKDAPAFAGMTCGPSGMQATFYQRHGRLSREYLGKFIELAGGKRFICFGGGRFLQLPVNRQGYLWTIRERCVMFSRIAGIVFDANTERWLAKAQTGRRALRRNA